MDSLQGNEIEGLEDSALDGKISRTKMLLESGHIFELSDNGQKLKRYLQRLLAERERRNQLPRQKAENDKAATAQRSNLIGMEPRGREAVLVRDDPSFAVCPKAEERAEQRRGLHVITAGPAQKRQRTDQEDEVVELREQIADIRSRLDMALRGVSEAGVADLDDEDLQVFIGVSPEWRSVLRRVAVAAAVARAQRPSARGEGPAQERQRMDQEDEVVELREQIADIRSRLDMALRGVSEAGVADLDDDDLQVFIGVSPEWRSVLRRVAVAAAVARAQSPSARGEGGGSATPPVGPLQVFPP